MLVPEKLPIERTTSQGISVYISVASLAREQVSEVSGLLMLTDVRTVAGV